jgi:[acyl-carrier-protein] S-malonyltransferase
MIAILCPGQGSQVPGFMTDWLAIDSYARTISQLEAVSSISLSEYGTVSDSETIRDTSIAQPLIVAAGLASLAALRDLIPEDTKFFGTAGHSVGEVTAAAVSGIFTNDQAINFVRQRGNAMKTAAALAPSSMAAVVGGELNEVTEYLSNLGLEIANFNSAGQVVAAGSKELIEKLLAEPMSGTRVVALQVAGAFHTSFMSTAKVELADFATQQEVQDPEIKIWTNRDGAEVSSGQGFIDLLVNQVSNPVRWDLCMESMVSSGVTAIIELSPAGTLTGIAKRAMPGVEAVALKAPKDLELASELIRKHG